MKERGSDFTRPKFHEVGDNEHYGYWRWPVSSCIHHTYYQISTTVQIFLISQNTFKQLANLHQLICEVVRWRMEIVRTIIGCWHWKFHACIFPGMHFLGLHVFGVTSSVFMVNGGSLLWHGGSNKKEVRTNQHSNLHGSTGCRHRFSCHLLRRQGWAHLSHISPKQMFNICAT